MGTKTLTQKLIENKPYIIKSRCDGKYDFVNTHTFTKENPSYTIDMVNYDGLQYVFNNQGGKGISIIDFSDTVLPWKFEMNDYLARTRYCLKPYREEPYQVEILKQVPANYNIVGTPTFNGDVVSGFNGNNYLTLNRKLVSKNEKIRKEKKLKLLF